VDEELFLGRAPALAATHCHEHHPRSAKQHDQAGPLGSSGRPPGTADAAARPGVAEAVLLLPSLLSLSQDFSLSQLECQCLPALCKCLAVGDRRAAAGCLGLLSGAATKAVALMLADLAGGLGRQEVAAWGYSEGEVEGLLRRFGGG
jgi:hypothetical protein